MVDTQRLLWYKQLSCTIYLRTIGQSLSSGGNMRQAAEHATIDKGPEACNGAVVP